MPTTTTLPGACGIRGPTELLRVPLPSALSVAEALTRLSTERLAFALTGSWAGGGAGGAILGSEPTAVAADDADPFAILDDLPTPAAAAPDGDGAVGGGWFGWLGYRLGRRIERVRSGPPRPVALPEFHLAFYDHVLRLDHDGQWWFEALVSAERRSALDARLAQLRAALAGPGEPEPPRPYVAPPPLILGRGAAEHHRHAVSNCRARIAAGEIFQANLCLRLESRWDGTATELMVQALTRTAPPFGAAFDTPRGGIASLSPELFLRRRGEYVVTAPIKGTIVRESGPAATAARARLLASGKDAAEHVMIVDLMRNDLGRVCRYGSITAPRAPTAEALPGLWHLVSEVGGRLRPATGHADLLRATFPPGSVTGAPKVQALQVIAALEASEREVYTGAIGYASPVAGLELSVAIRTLELRDGALWLGAGGGIVAESDPETELDEALAKARPVAAAIGTTVALAASGGRIRARRWSERPDPTLGVFETLRVSEGHIHGLDGHLERLDRSLRRLYRLVRSARLPGELEARAATLSGPHRLRVDAVPRDGAVEIESTTSPLAPGPAPGVLGTPVLVPGGLGEHKWRDRRWIEALTTGDDVPLMMDREGCLLEAAWGNLWLREGDRLITPPADGRLLPGVTRARLIELAPALGFAVAEEPISLARAVEASAVFLTSSLRLVVPATITSHPDPGSGSGPISSGPELERLRAALSRAW
ncbi:MAG: chorismate-binding protein [Solirubrobacteraceae bacterium]